MPCSSAYYLRALPLAGLLILLATTFAGCFSYRTARKDGSIAVHHFGYVRELRPPATGGIQVNDFASLGLHLDTAMTIGLWASRHESVPLDNRVVFRVANEAQLHAALRALSPEQRQTTCILVDPSP